MSLNGINCTTFILLSVVIFSANRICFALRTAKMPLSSATTKTTTTKTTTVPTELNDRWINTAGHWPFHQVHLRCSTNSPVQLFLTAISHQVSSQFERKTDIHLSKIFYQSDTSHKLLDDWLIVHQNSHQGGQHRRIHQLSEKCSKWDDWNNGN